MTRMAGQALAAITPGDTGSVGSLAAPVLHLRHVSKTYQETAVRVAAVRDVSLLVRAGEVVALTGPSGCGKSTLLAIAGTLLEADSGEVELGGVRVDDLSFEDLAALRRRSIGFVFQELNLMPSLDALENVSLPLELDGRRRRDARRLAAESLERVGAGELSRRFPAQLSGGQRQRVAVARAVIGDRRLVLADEPTGALDSVSAQQILDLLAGVAEQGCAVLLVTHSPAQAAVAGRRVQMVDGRVGSATVG